MEKCVFKNPNNSIVLVNNKTEMPWQKPEAFYVPLFLLSPRNSIPSSSCLALRGVKFIEKVNNMDAQNRSTQNIYILMLTNKVYMQA